MTKLIKKNNYRRFIPLLYKSSILFYSLYLAYSPQVFALQAEAPVASDLIIQKHQLLVSQKKSIDLVFQERTKKIEKYFARHNLPLGKQAKYFVISADKYDIDWTLLAAIGFIESTGGKFACKTVGYNAWGWGSCTLGFDSYPEAIDTISKNLAGQYEKTAHHYAGKDVRGILQAYNPPSVVPDYADKVMREMRIIKKQ